MSNPLQLNLLLGGELPSDGQLERSCIIFIISRVAHVLAIINHESSMAN